MHGTYGVYAVSIIVVCYVTFAIQLLIQVRWARRLRTGALSLFALVAVFVLCACAGYVSDYLPERYWRVREALHWVLAGAALWLVFANAGGAVARLLSE